MQESVMVTDANWLNKNFGEDHNHVIRVNVEEFLNLIENNYKFIPRNIAETSNAYKQIVSYCLITYRDKIFITQRTSKQTEKRLHNRFSVGIGGHISSVDQNSSDIVISGMLRELFEEVRIPQEYSCNFFGIINDNSSEVNSVHTGVCFVIQLKTEDCNIIETEKMHGFWVNKDELNMYKDNLEGWSSILLNSYFEDKI